MSVTVAKSAGFCFGVSRAVETVEQAAQQGGSVATLGPIIHNRHVVQRFEGLGVRVISAPEEANPDMTVIIRDTLLEDTVLERIVARLKNELGADDVQVERGLSLIVVVGEGMKHGVGVAAAATSALSKAGVNISMISQGSSEVSMIFAVKREHENAGVKALYDAFLGKQLLE